MDFKKNLKIKMKLARELKGLTQVQVAEKVGIDINYYRFLENGYRTPSLKVLMKLIKVLNFSVDDMLKSSKISAKESMINSLIKECNENELEIILATVNSIIKNRK